MQEAGREAAAAGSVYVAENEVSRIAMGLAIVGSLVAVMLALLFVRIASFLGG